MGLGARVSGMPARIAEPLPSWPAADSGLPASGPINCPAVGWPARRVWGSHGLTGPGSQQAGGKQSSCECVLHLLAYTG